MPVFIRNGRRALYAHVPKTGGTSVEALFARNGFETWFLDTRDTADAVHLVMHCSPQHMHAEMLKSLFKLEMFDAIFMTVRHPVARMVSEYRMRAGDGSEVPPIDQWIEETLALWPISPFMLDNHIRPQADFFIPGCAVFRLEDGYDADFVARLSGLLGCSFDDPAMPEEMRGNPNLTVKPSAASQARIADFYRRDFQLFGYPLPGAAGVSGA